MLSQQRQSPLQSQSKERRTLKCLLEFRKKYGKMKEGKNVNTILVLLIEHRYFRVAISPAATSVLTKNGFQVKIEDSAGVGANFLNQDYVNANAKIVNKDEVFNSGLNDIFENSQLASYILILFQTSC